MDQIKLTKLEGILKTHKRNYQMTNTERKWRDRIIEHGCIACEKDGHGYVPASMHHITQRGRRMGHLFSIPLCAAHHQYGGVIPTHDGAARMISLHLNKSEFTDRYGSELELLDEVKRRIGWIDAMDT
jgi:hypothetical protein